MGIVKDLIGGIGDAAEGIGRGVATGAEVFTENAEKKGQRESQEFNAVLQQYQAEFNRRENRTWVDSFADGFNRLIRPLIVTIIISIFLIAYMSPVRFEGIATALGYIPEGYWMLLSVIVTFYFGGRMQLKSQNFKLQASQVQAVQQAIQQRKAFRQLDGEPDEPAKHGGDSVAKAPEVEGARTTQENKVVKVLKQKQAEDKADDGTLNKVVQAIKNEPVDDDDQQDDWVKKRDAGDPFWFQGLSD